MPGSNRSGQLAFNDLAASGPFHKCIRVSAAKEYGDLHGNDPPDRAWPHAIPTQRRRANTRIATQLLSFPARPDGGVERAPTLRSIRIHPVTRAQPDGTPQPSSSSPSLHGR